MIAFEIPGHPIAFARARVSLSGHRFTPKPQMSFANFVSSKAAECMRGAAPFDGPMSVTVRATFVAPASWSKKKREAAVWKTSKPDLDNIVKLVKDGLSKVVYGDDAQVAQIIAQKVYGLREAVTVEISQL